jgi:ferredoxin
MVVETNTDEIRHYRKQALELLLSDHAGDCEAPCNRICPCNLDIPGIIRFINAGLINDAIIAMRENLPLSGTLGSICPAPCEKGCRKKKVDESVHIKTLHRLLSAFDLGRNKPWKPSIPAKLYKNIGIIGAGPAGLSVAYFLALYGYTCSIYDDHGIPGGMIEYSISQTAFDHSILHSEIDTIRNMGIKFYLNTSVGKDISFNTFITRFDAVIICTGNSSQSHLKDPTSYLDNFKINIDFKTGLTNHTNIFACGGIVHPGKIAARSIGHARKMAGIVHQYLLTGNNNTEITRKFDSHLGKLFDGEIDEFKKITKFYQKFNTNSQTEPVREILTISQSCLNCDCIDKNTCPLRHYSDIFDVKQYKYRGRPRKRFTRDIYENGLVQESGKCILCGRCVNITEKSGLKYGVYFHGRGFPVYIKTPFSKPLDKSLGDLQDRCIEACPTGALSRYNRK